MATGTIRTSDIVTDDNLDALIAKMRALEATMDALTDSIRNTATAAATLAQQTTNLNTTTTAGRASVANNASAADRLQRTYNRLQETYTRTGREMVTVQGLIGQQNRLNRLNATLANAQAGSYQALSAQYSINVIRLNAMSRAERETTQAGRDLVAQTRALREEMHRLQSEVGNNTLNVGNYGSAIEGLRARFTDFIKGGFIVAGVTAIGTAITGLISKVLPQNALISDSLADVQRIAQLSADESNRLLGSLKALDTRTALDELLKFAAVGARLGVAKNELADFTSSLDSLNVALGGELGGDVEEVANRLGKLATIFGEDKNVTGDEILKIGNAVVDLANKGTASGEFLSDFSQRLAGISGIAKVTLGQSLGLGAGFQELGQSSEVAGTAVTQLVLKLGQDVPKYAKLAGESAKDFGDLLNNNPVEALIRLSEGITQNKSSFAELSEAFADSEARGVRVSATLGVIGKNADFFRQKIEDGTNALQKTDQITSAVAIKQQTLGAVLDKTGKAFIGLFINSGIATFFKSALESISGLVTGITNLINPSERLAKEFEKTSESVALLEKELPKLLDRYDELNSKTVLSKAEQREMGDVIKRIGELTPTAITEIDKYGNAISINTGKSREWLRTEKARLAFINKEVITSTEAQIKDLQRELEFRQKIIKAGEKSSVIVGASGGSELVTKQLTPDQIRQIQGEVANLQSTLQGATAQLNFLKTGTTEVEAGNLPAYFGSTAAAVEGVTDATNEDTSATDKNTKSKKKAVDVNEELAKQAALQLKYQRELKDLLGEEGGLLGLLGTQATEVLQPDKFYAIGRNVGAAFGEGFGDASPLQSIFDANAEKDVKAKMADLAAKANAVVKGELSKNQSAFERLAGGESIYDLLGLDLDDKGKQQVQDSFAFAKQQLTDYLAFRTEIANRNVANADREVQAAQANLDNEFKLQAAGLANQVETRRKELEEAKKAQEKALKQQEQVAKAERAIQTAQQAVNIVTGISKLFAEKNVLAIPLAALMVASFVGFKIAATAAAKRQYGQGGSEFIGGGSHASGNDTYLGFQSEGKPAFAEKGEFHGIVRKERVPKYRSLLPEIINSLNKGVFENEFQRMGNASAGIPLIVNVGGTTISTGRMERTLDQIHKQGLDKTYVDGKGRLVRTYKNLTQIIEP